MHPLQLVSVRLISHLLIRVENKIIASLLDTLAHTCTYVLQHVTTYKTVLLCVLRPPVKLLHKLCVVHIWNADYFNHYKYSMNRLVTFYKFL